MRYAKYTQKWTNCLPYLCWVFLPQRCIRTWVLPFSMKSNRSIFIHEVGKRGGPWTSLLLHLGSITRALEIHIEMQKWVVIILGHHSIPRSQIVMSLWPLLIFSATEKASPMASRLCGESAAQGHAPSLARLLSRVLADGDYRSLPAFE